MRIINRFLFVLTLGVIAATQLVHAASSKTVTLVYEPIHNPPQALGRGTAIDWSKPGLTLELLRLVGKQLGVDFQFKRVPWKRGLYLVKKNQVDGIFHASYKEKREKVGGYPKREGAVDPQRSIFFQSYVLYTLKSSTVDFDGTEVVGIDGDIGVMSGYSIAEKLEKMGLSIDPSPTQEMNFSRLSSGKIEAFATLENMADDFLSRNNDHFTSVDAAPSLEFNAIKDLRLHRLLNFNSGPHGVGRVILVRRDRVKSHQHGIAFELDDYASIFCNDPTGDGKIVINDFHQIFW